MEFERIPKSAIPPNAGRNAGKGRYHKLWEALDVLDDGEAILIRGLLPIDVQRIRTAARVGAGRHLTFRISTQYSSGVLYITRCRDDKAPKGAIREFAAVR